MAVKLFELRMAGAVVVLLALVMMMLITELLGNSPWEEAGEARGGRESELGDGEEPVPAGSSVRPWEKCSSCWQSRGDAGLDRRGHGPDAA